MTTPMLPPIVPLWKHQSEILPRMLEGKYFALFWEMGCIAHDAIVRVNRGRASRSYTMEKLYRLFNHQDLTWRERGFSRELPTHVRSLKGDHIGLHKITAVLKSGKKEVVRIQLETTSLKLTRSHRVWTKRGWVQASKLKDTDLVATDKTAKHQNKENPAPIKPKMRYNLIQVGRYHKYARQSTHPRGGVIWVIEKHRAILEAKENGLTLLEFQKQTKKRGNGLAFINPQVFHVHHKDSNHKNNGPENLEKLTIKEHMLHHTLGYKNFGHGNVYWEKVIAVTPAGREMTYDIVCEDPHRNFVANNIVVHNCGKTATTINALRQLSYRRQRVQRTLILCPLVMVETWRREIGVHSKLLPSTATLRGTGKKRLETFQKALEESPDKIMITNFEAIQSKELYAAIEAWRPEVMVIDESQKIKHYKSLRTKLITALGDRSDYRYILSGTPITNTPMDIFGQFRFLDGGLAFERNFFAFRNTYFYDKNDSMKGLQKYFPDWRPKPGIEKLFNEKIYRHASRILKKDCLDLPPVVPKVTLVEMAVEQRRMYDSMKKSFVAYLGDVACVATIALTKALRLQQIVSGFFIDDAGVTHQFKGNPRLEALRELVELIVPNEKLIIWSTFKQNHADITGVLKELKIPYSELVGGMTDKSRTEGVDAFQTDPKRRVMVANQQAGGVGVTLTAASTMIYYSRTYSLEADLQSEARAHRGGSEIHEKITRIDLVAPATIDEVVMEALFRKMTLAELILKLKETV